MLSCARILTISASQANAHTMDPTSRRRVGEQFSLARKPLELGKRRIGGICALVFRLPDGVELAAHVNDDVLPAGWKAGRGVGQTIPNTAHVPIAEAHRLRDWL